MTSAACWLQPDSNLARLILIRFLWPLQEQEGLERATRLELAASGVVGYREGRSRQADGAGEQSEGAAKNGSVPRPMAIDRCCCIRFLSLLSEQKA